MQKKCGRCQVRKDVAEFDTNNTRYDGLDSTCKCCKAEKQRSVESKNRPVNRMNWADRMLRRLRIRGSDY